MIAVWESDISAIFIIICLKGVAICLIFFTEFNSNVIMYSQKLRI